VIVQLCAFQAGATAYAIDIMRIDEVLSPREVTPVPDAPAWIEGVINLRGTLVPVVNVRRRLDGEGTPDPRLRPRWLIIFVGHRRFALSVDGVTEVVRVRRGELEPLDPTRGPYVIGSCGAKHRGVLLLDVKALLRVKT
jgi:purine-binding chemotaxis protein CheW